MFLHDGDYSDLVTYLTNMFSIKKIKEVTIDRYRIRYDSVILISGKDLKEESRVDRFPEKDERERVKTITFLVTDLLSNYEGKVSINWDYVEFANEIEETEATEFVDTLDRSTFRYF